MNKIFLLVSKILNERIDDMGGCWGGHCTGSVKESEGCSECMDEKGNCVECSEDSIEGCFGAGCSEKTVQENIKPSKKLLEFLKK